MKVKVYYNLHKKCYSIVSLEKENYGRVVAHSNCVPLFNAQFKVSEKGRQRVLREQKKNVHAYVVGTWVRRLKCIEKFNIATYNPYKYSSFIDATSKKPLAKAKEVLLSKRHFVGRETSQIYYVA